MFNIFFSAIEQFNSRVVTTKTSIDINKELESLIIYPITNLVLSAIFIIFILFYFFFFNYSKKVAYFIMKLNSYVINIIDSNLIKTKNTLNFRTSFLVLFYFILINNFIGLIPNTFTLTSQLWVTFTIASIYFVGITFFGIKMFKIKFFKLFWPSNVPLIILPFLCIVESISYISRIFSLSIRLFANIMAGHTLIHIISDFSISFYSKKKKYLYRLLFLLPIVMVFFITILEIGVTFLQAYVFLILLCIYLNDILNVLEH